MAQSSAVRRQNRRYLEERLYHSEKGYPKKKGPNFIKHGLTPRQRTKRRKLHEDV